ncbi:MAG: BMP family ABC transporter substrate-binding protein [Oscillospiraceae bacterium]|nr:BMP family ABC transporter substrate-binding protein [Oscillospiraceae bacterium]
MMGSEAYEQYRTAQKAGKKYYREAVAAGRYPYPAVLDEILEHTNTVGKMDLGVITIPTDLIVGTRSAGRGPALAGNFMPLLEIDSEFGSKWVRLCEAHLGPEGIRDAPKVYEYLGRFYVEEGNKRVSVLLSYGARSIPAHVIRILPEYSEDRDIQRYYEFVHFHTLSGQYGVQMQHRGEYARLVAALGMEPDHIWTMEERRHFAAGFSRFSDVFREADRGISGATAGQALLVWLGVFRFADIKTDSRQELLEKLRRLQADFRLVGGMVNADIQTEADDALESEKSRSLLPHFGLFGRKQVRVAFIYAYDLAESAWTRSHDYARQYLEEHFGGSIQVAVYNAADRQYYRAMEQAIEDGAELLFATTPSMMDACRRIAVEHRQAKILNCSPSLPYAGVVTYYSRIYEVKFIAGAIAGAMSQGDSIGFIANYPIMGVYANINAFALGVKLTNPRARVKLRWSCLPGDPVAELLREGVTVISNRDATTTKNEHQSLEWGTYSVGPNGFETLAVPCWNWEQMYEKLILGMVNGAWNMAEVRPVNLWWGLKSGVTDIQFGHQLPDGMLNLAKILKTGLAEGRIDPFDQRIVDRDGVLRCDGSTSLSPEEIINMNWLCDNVDGITPEFEDLLPESKELVRLLGIDRGQLQPEREEKQL